MKTLIFAKRNMKEIIRDPLTVFFGLCFPVIIMLLLTLIQSNIPTELFSINKLAPGISVFGLSFISLFSGMLIAKDRSSAFCLRLYSSPIKPYQFISGYIIPFIPLALLQSALCLIIAIPLGLKPGIGMLTVLIASIPASFLYIGIGILCGTFLSDKQVGGICGALLTNVSAWLSGIWFDFSLLGKTLEGIAKSLPFANAVISVQAVFAGDLTAALKPIIIVSAYAAALFAGAVILFSAKIKSDNK